MPTPPDYLNFDFSILPRGENKYRVRVTESPEGQANADFEFATANDLEKLYPPGNAPLTLETLKALGKKLYQLAFSGDVHACLRAGISGARKQGKNLRLRLNLSEAPELAALPWEFLYDASKNQFFSMSSETPLVRFFDLPDPQDPLRVAPPLQILVMLSQDGTFDQAAADREWENLNDAVADLKQRKLIELERHDQLKIGELRALLRQREVHVLHYIGRSAFDATAGQGTILLHDDKGNAREIGGDVLAILLSNHEPLRLVILASGDGAHSNRSNIFSGVAQTLMQQGIPAIIAMQSEISPTAARIFSREFYLALADNYPIDAAMSEGRKAIFSEDSQVEWATPVLYSRAPDGVLFKVGTAPPAVPPPPPPERPAQEPLTFRQLLDKAASAQKRAEQIWQDDPAAETQWRQKYQEAFDLLERADQLHANDEGVLLRMAQIQARLDPEYGTRAKSILYHLEDLIAEPHDDNQVRVLAEAFLLHATLSEPPSEKMLQRARPLFQQLNDTKKMEQIDAQLKRVAGPVVQTPAVLPPAQQEFNPSGRWNIQVQDMVGSRLFVDFKANGTFQMTQQVGMYQVPVSGNWNFNPLTRQLALQGVVNTFQPFILALTLGNALPNGFIATGSDGIGYVLTRDA